VAIASLAGLLFQSSIYPTDELVESFVPNDVVNFVVGVPILLASMWLARRDRLLGLLFWPGALFYVFYTYLVYVLSMPLNVGFLLNLALIVLSAYTMMGLLASIDGEAVKQQLGGAVSERVGGGVLAGLGALFLLRAGAMLIGGLTSQEPMVVTEAALNVSDFLTAPALIIGGVLLWRREALGYVVGLGLLFHASMAFLGLTLVLILQPFVIGAEFALVDVVVVLIMGMVCFVPFGLFARGAVSRDGRSPAND
jgi:hypothetical protein